MVDTGISHILKRSHIEVFKKFVKFIGPGIMVSVAYMDPGNNSKVQIPELSLLTVDQLIPCFA